jgi:hypothetical protein
MSKRIGSLQLRSAFGGSGEVMLEGAMNSSIRNESYALYSGIEKVLFRP